MNKLIYIILALAAGLCGSCAQDTVFERATPNGALVMVTLPVGISSQEVVSRATDETRIQDVNLFLVQGKTVLQQIYAAGQTIQFSCPVGYYQLFVVVNQHMNIGILSYDQLMNYSIWSRDRYDDLPMGTMQSVEIKMTGGVLTLPMMEVSRTVAKINYLITVDPAVSDITIKSMQTMSLPRQTCPFQKFRPSTVSEDYYNAPIIANTGSTSRMTGTLYMLPNLQGNVTGITTPDDKNSSHAPALATYLRIRAIRGSKILDYAVYLGDNMLSNFDVRPNTAHTLNITIRGDNTTDVRIRCYTIDIKSVIDAEPENGVYLQTAPITLSVTLGGQMQEMSLSCELIVTSGNRTYFNMTGLSDGDKYILGLNGAPGTRDYAIQYMPPDFAPENVRLAYTVNFYDKYGLAVSYSFTYSYARVFRVYTQWYNEHMGTSAFGKVASPNAMLRVEVATLTSCYYLFYCDDTGCTLDAFPNAGRVFNGWYRAHDNTGSLGYERRYVYTPKQSPNIIYAHFI